MVTGELAGTIHGPVAARWHARLLLMVVRWVVLLLLLLMLKVRPADSRSSHVTWMMVVMMRDRIAGPNIELWCWHTRLPGRRWPVHTLVVHMVGMRGRSSRWTLTQWRTGKIRFTVQRWRTSSMLLLLLLLMALN